MTDRGSNESLVARNELALDSVSALDTKINPRAGGMDGGIRPRIRCGGRNGLLFGEDAGSRGEEEARRENFTVIGPWCRGGSLRIMKVRIDRNSPLPSKRVDDEPRFDQPAGYREKDGTWRGITGAASFAWKFMTDGRRSKIRRTISAGTFDTRNRIGYGRWKRKRGEGAGGAKISRVHRVTAPL